MKPHFLAAKTALAIAIMACSMATPTKAQGMPGIPVTDGGNLQQNILSAMESVNQTLKQIQQYQTQLQQYENMLQNTLAPAAYIWDKAQSTMNNLMSTVDTLKSYKDKFGNLDAYLDKFQDINYYRNSPCFSAGGCSEAEQAEMEKGREMASESQNKANKALFKSLESQQDALKKDSRQLEKIQTSAQGATGQLQAIAYANQLAAQQANQLLQIRGMLVAQQNADAAKIAAELDEKSRGDAKEKQLNAKKFKPSSASRY